MDVWSGLYTVFQNTELAAYILKILIIQIFTNRFLMNVLVSQLLPQHFLPSEDQIHQVLFYSIAWF